MSSLISHISPMDDCPLYAVPPKMQRIALALIQAKQVSSSIVVPILSGGTALLVQDLFEIVMPGGGHKPLSNTTWLSAPSTCGKSLIADPIFAPILERQLNTAAAHEAADRLGDEEHADEASQAPTAFAPNPLYQNATPDSIFPGLAKWRSSGVLDDEGTMLRDPRFVPNIPTLNKLHDGASVIVDRKGSGKLVLKSTRLSTLILTQPDITRRFDARHGAVLRNSGYGGRARVVHMPDEGSPRFMSDVPLPEPNLSEWVDAVNDFLDETDSNIQQGIFNRKPLQFEAPAVRYLASMHNEYVQRGMPGGDLAGLPEHCGRLLENVARMAGEFHAFEQMSGHISAETVERAATLMRWYSEHYKRRFLPPPNMPPAHADALRLEQALHFHRRHYGTWSVPKTVLRDGVLNLGLPGRRFERALELLCEWHRVWVVTQGRTKWVNLNAAYFL